MIQSFGSVYEKTESTVLNAGKSHVYFDGIYELKLESISGTSATVKIIDCPDILVAPPQEGFGRGWGIGSPFGGIVVPFNYLASFVFD